MPPDLQPTLRGVLVHLRPLRPDDAEALYAAASDPLIWAQHPDARHERPVFDAFFRDALASGGALLATDPTTGAVIGTSRYADYDEAAREVEIGWTFLARPYWGGAVNAEMKALMVAHAALFADHVRFVVAEGNVRSQRAVERIGGVAAGEARPGHRLYRLPTRP